MWATRWQRWRRHEWRRQRVAHLHHHCHAGSMVACPCFQTSLTHANPCGGCNVPRWCAQAKCTLVPKRVDMCKAHLATPVEYGTARLAWSHHILLAATRYWAPSKRTKQYWKHNLAPVRAFAQARLQYRARIRSQEHLCAWYAGHSDM